ncbi:MAG: hypothetical protein ACOYXR_07635 [Nitrospirota bacterium]
MTSGRLPRLLIPTVSAMGEELTARKRHARLFAGSLRQLSGLALGVGLLVLAGCGNGAGSTDAQSPSDPVNLSTAVLNWDAPSTSEDGTPIADLAGYRVYYGTTEPVTKSNSDSVDVGDTLGHTFDSLPAGTYYFAVAAYDLYNNESELSGSVTKVISEG